MGSQDGQFWFRIASNPEREPAAKLAGEFGQMTRRVYNGNHTDFTTWDQVVALIEERQADRGRPSRAAPSGCAPEGDDELAKPFAVHLARQVRAAQSRRGSLPGERRQARPCTLDGSWSCRSAPAAAASMCGSMPARTT